MSSAVYPLGMNSMPASGYTHKSTYYNKQYRPWKGTGINSFPVGTAAGHIRPLTNNDPGNVFQTGFGLARPIKHYRKGRVIPPNMSSENPLINYNMNRFVKSSKGTSLGGGFGGSGLLNEMQDKPGAYIVKQNTCRQIESNNLNNENWNLVYTDFSQPDVNVTTSGTGQYLLVTNYYNNNILVSNDYGKTWTQITLTNLQPYIVAPAAAISFTGQYQVVCSATDNGGVLSTYFSNDYGATWNETTITLPNTGYIIYYGLSMSYDGLQIIICVSNNFSNEIYKSTNNGQSYTSITNITGIDIVGSAMSSNGQQIVLVGGNPGVGEIYLSTDYGVTFNVVFSLPNTTFVHVAMSSNGKYLIASDFNNGVLYYSQDFGQNWNLSSGITSQLCNGLNMSADGSLMVALLYDTITSNGYIYISKDYGISWTIFGEPPGLQPAPVAFYYSSAIAISLIGNLLAYVTTDTVNSSEIFILNNINAVDCNQNITENCKTCEGVGIVASYKPNIGNLTQDPAPNTSNPVLCCNQEKFAKRRVVYASTNLKKNYYTSHKQYLQNRCKTYQQKAFNFLSYKTNGSGPYDNNNPYYYSVDGDEGPKPGSPLALLNTYLANCQLNAQLYEGSENALIGQMLSIMLNQHILTQSQVNAFNATGINSIAGFFDWLQALGNQQALLVFKAFIANPYSGMPLSGPSNPTGCQLTVYKPNNYQFAQQGAVSSSTRMLKLNVNTISTNAASIQNYNNTGAQLVTANQLYTGDANNYSNLLKNKVPNCNEPWPLNMSQSRQYQNKKFCFYQNDLPAYQLLKSQPSTYRYFPRAVCSSNHYSQSPNTYNTTAGSAAYE